MIQWDIHGIYPLVISYIAIENGPVEIVSFPIHSMIEIVSFPINSIVMFHRFLCVYQPLFKSKLINHDLFGVKNGTPSAGNALNALERLMFTVSERKNGITSGNPSQGNGKYPINYKF